jgi:hypothetical protein
VTPPPAAADNVAAAMPSADDLAACGRIFAACLHDPQLLASASADPAFHPVLEFVRQHPSALHNTDTAMPSADDLAACGRLFTTCLHEPQLLASASADPAFHPVLEFVRQHPSALHNGGSVRLSV